MKFRSTSPVGSAVNINGNIYMVTNGVINVDKEADINKLLKLSGSWTPIVERTPVVTEATTVVEETVEDNGEEYPDPNMKMTVAELHRIADAYEVTYSSKTTKRQLVNAIMKAMYG